MKFSFAEQVDTFFI